MKQIEIEEVFLYKGNLYKCKEQFNCIKRCNKNCYYCKRNPCENCAFSDSKVDCVNFKCIRYYRQDKRSVIFEEYTHPIFLK